MAEEKRFAKEREKIESFSDFSNVYNFKKDFKYSHRPMRALLKK